MHHRPIEDCGTARKATGIDAGRVRQPQRIAGKAAVTDAVPLRELHQ